MEPAVSASTDAATPATTSALHASCGHTLPSHHPPMQEPEVPLVLPSPETPTAAPHAPRASLLVMKGKLKSAATKVIADQRVKRAPSLLFKEVVKDHRTMIYLRSLLTMHH